MSNEMKKSLRDRAKELGGGLPFMNGRNKGDFKHLLGLRTAIIDYGFMTESSDGQSREYVAFIVEGFEKEFFFGGTVLTDQMRILDGEGFGDEIRENGLPVLFGEKRSKNGRTYTTVEFYPE